MAQLVEETGFKEEQGQILVQDCNESVGSTSKKQQKKLAKKERLEALKVDRKAKDKANRKRRAAERQEAKANGDILPPKKKPKWDPRE